MITPRTLPGVSDFFPQEMALRQYIKDVWRKVFEKYGYGQLETPAIEYAEILLGKYGEEEKLIYNFKDKGGRHIALKYDHTVPLARATAQYLNKECKLPFKRYEINRVWRAEAARKGRKREFYQCDIDILGVESILADSEVLFVIYEGFKELGFKDHIINISHRKLLESFTKLLKIPAKKSIEVFRAVDKLDKIGINGVKEELEKRKIPKKAILEIQDFIDEKNKTNAQIIADLEELLHENKEAQKSIQDLKEVICYLEMYGIPEKNYKINPSLVRGLDYYTGLVFEVVDPNFGRSAIAGGGRYDNLCGLFSNQQIAGVGISVGFERVYEIMKEAKIEPRNIAKTEVLITIFSPELLQDTLTLAKELRAADIKTEIYLEEGDKLKKQFQYADQKKIPFVIVIGPEEKEKGSTVLKNMETGEQEEVGRDEIVEKIKRISK